jgi:DNA mismatch repair protein MutS2
MSVAKLEEFAAEPLDYLEVRALFERLTLSSLGRAALRRLEPRGDEQALAAHERARAMVELLSADRAPGLAGVTDIEPPLQAARKFSRPLDKEEFCALVGFLEACARLLPWLQGLRQTAPALFELSAGFPDLGGLQQELSSQLDEKGEVRPEASPKLARLAKDQRELTEQLDGSLRRLLGNAAVRANLSDTSVHLRGGRRVLAVKAKSSGRVPGLLVDRSSSGETAFIEPRECTIPAQKLAAVEIDLRREEQRILLELTRSLFGHEPRLLAAAGRLAELELALVSALFCREYSARVPAVARSRDGARATLVLRGARHPLLVEQVRRGELESVVPIDVRLGADFDLLVITGPNTGGKTLALKTVGIAALLARLGLPFPCDESSRIPLYEGICADIGDEQEIRQSLSTFSSHLARIRAGMARATPHTLLLLDELGGGTDPDEGAALSDAILEHLLERGVPSIATTHLSKLKEFAFRNARAENASVAFDPQSLRPLYRLLIGTPGESCALLIAKRLGLDPKLCQRAAERLVRRDREVAELMEKMRGAREQAERTRSDAEDRLREIEAQNRSLSEERGAVARKSELLESEAQLGLEERVREARRALSRAIAMLPQLSAVQGAAMREVLEQVESELSGASLTERRKQFLDALEKNRYVYVPRLKKRVVIAKVDRAKRELSVRLGHMLVQIAFDEDTSAEAP